MKRKICFLTDSLFSVGGVQRVTAVIAKSLSADYDVTIVSFDQPENKDTSFYDLAGTPLTYRFFQYPTPIRWKKMLCKTYSAIYRKSRLPWQWASNLYAHSSFPSELRNALASELRQGNYDIVIGVHAPLAVRLAAIKNQLQRAKTIGWIHNSFEALYGPGSLYIGPELKRHYVYQLQKLDTCVVLCRHDAETYRQFDQRFRPRVIYNPLTLVPGPPSKGNSHQFLGVGRFSRRHKGFDLLIDAFHLVSMHCPDWTLHLVGEGPEEPVYRQKIKDYGLENRVVIHPFTHHIQTYYSAAQVYVLSSRWEGFGLVLVEAMAHGLPVVSSNLPTSQEIMGKNAIYFENGNTEELAQRLLEATTMDWPQQSAEAIRTAKRFGVADIIGQWKSLFCEL